MGTACADKAFAIELMILRQVILFSLRASPLAEPQASGEGSGEGVRPPSYE